MLSRSNIYEISVPVSITLQERCISWIFLAKKSWRYEPSGISGKFHPKTHIYSWWLWFYPRHCTAPGIKAVSAMYMSALILIRLLNHGLFYASQEQQTCHVIAVLLPRVLSSLGGCGRAGLWHRWSSNFHLETHNTQLCRNLRGIRRDYLLIILNWEMFYVIFPRCTRCTNPFCRCNRCRNINIQCDWEWVKIKCLSIFIILLEHVPVLTWNNA